MVYDKRANFSSYRHMQELFSRIYSETRNDAAISRYGPPFASLSAAQQDEIKKIYPIRVVELD